MTPSEQQLQLLKYLETLPENCNRYQMAINQIANLERLKYRVDVKPSNQGGNWKRFRFRNIHFKSILEASQKMVIPYDCLQKDIKTALKFTKYSKYDIANKLINKNKMEKQTVEFKKWSGYPMHFTEKLVTERTEKNMCYGKSYYTLALEKELKVGDILEGNSVKHTIIEILETRKAKGNHPIEAIFQSVVCDFSMPARNV